MDSWRRAGTNTTDWTVSWGQAGGDTCSTIEDQGRWVATGLGTSSMPADLIEKRLESKPIPEGQDGLGPAPAAIVNETGSLQAAEIVAVNANCRPGLMRLAGG